MSKNDSPNFYNATFEKLLIIDCSEFQRVPDFRMANFGTGISMYNISVDYRAKRFYETKGWQLIPNLLYEWFSKYGQSIIRPFISLFFVWLGFTLIYIYKDLLPEKTSPLLFSVSQLVPFMGSSKIFTKNLINPTDLSNWVYFLAFVENLLGLVFIFLIVLALRNRFKLKT